MQSNYDYSEFAPKNDEEEQYDYSEFAPKKKEESLSMFNPLDRFKFLVSAAASNPVQNAAAINEGVRRTGQGVKQAGLWAGEKLGFDTGRKEYTQEVEASRRAFGETPAGKSPYGQAITEGVQMAPLAALPIGPEVSMIKNMLTGGAGFGAYEGLQFVPEGESRLGHMTKGAAIGAAFPWALNVAPKIANKALDIAEPLFKGEIRKAASEANPWQLINKTDPALTEQRKQLKSQISDIKEKIPQAAEKLAVLEPEVLAAQEAAELSKKEHIATKKAAESNTMVAKSRDSAIQLDLNKADIALQNLNKSRQETEAKIGETTVPEPFEHDAKIAELEKSAQEKQAVADQYEAEMKAKDEEFKTTQEAATENPLVGVGNKASIQREINKGQIKKSDAERAKIAKEQEHQENLEVEHKAEQEASKATHEKLQAEANMSKAESQAKASENAVKATDHNISQWLDKRKEHDVDAAVKIFEITDAERKAISAEFTAVEEDIANTNIQLSNEAAVKQKNAEILSLIHENKLHTPEMQGLLDELEVIKNTPTTIPASQYLKIYNTARQESQKARAAFYQRGATDLEREASQAKFNALDEKIEEMADILEKGIGKENSARLAKARADWRDNVASLYKNSIYQNIQWHGKMNDDIMHSLRGTNKGTVKIRNTILNNPDIAKDVLGQKFARNPHKVSDIGVQEEQYINAVPEFKSMVEQRNAASQLAESSQARHQASKEAHANAKVKESEAHTAYKDAKTLKGKTKKALNDLNKSIDEVVKQEPELIKYRDELVRIAKEQKTTLPKKLQAESEVEEINAHLKQVKDAKIAHEKEIKTRQDEIAKHTSDLEKINSDIAGFQEKIPHQKAALQDITEKAENRKIAFEEKAKLEKEKANLAKIVATGESTIKRLKNEQARLNEKIDNSRKGLYKYIKGSAKQVPRLWRWSKRLFKGV